MINKPQRGFTLIELTLVMAFMSVLLLAILFLTLHAGKIYTKGITNKTLNQIGRDVSDMMRRDFAVADAGLINTPVAAGSGDATSGRVCTGSVSYIWNSANLLNSGSTKVTSGGSPITLRRVIDPSQTLCTIDSVSGAYLMDIPNTMTSSELLSSNNRNYAVYSMTFAKVASVSAKGLYRVNMVIGTNEQDTTQKDVIYGFQCKPPSNDEANFDYCTVSEFEMILRSGGDKE